MASRFSRFQTTCACGRTTTHKFARAHEGRCKSCDDMACGRTTTPAAPRESRADREHGQLLDAGYQAYSRERGDYDTGDY